MGIESVNVKSAIFALYAMSFLTSSGFGAFGVIVPLYMRDLGVSFIGLGLAFGVFGIVMGGAAMFFGAHSDQVGRKPYLLLSLLLSGVVGLFYILARSMVDFVVLQALSGVSSALSGVIIPALMTDLTKDFERGRKFGRMGGFGWIGVGFGYFLGGAASQIFGYGPSFLLISVMRFISCVLVLVFVPSYSLPSRERFSIGLIKGLSSNLKVWLAISFATALVIGPVEVLVIPSYVVSPGPLGSDKIIFGSFMSASYIITSSTQFVGGHLADKYNRRKLACIFYLLSAPFILVQPLFLSFPFFASMYLLEGIGEGLNHPCTNAIVASAARQEHRGFDFSVVNFFGNIASTIGFLAIGLMLDITGFAYPFIIRGIVYAVAAGLTYFGLKDSSNVLSEKQPEIKHN